MEKFEAGQTILDVVGPLGKPSHIEKFGTVVCVGGGVGVAPVLPIAKASLRQEIRSSPLSAPGQRICSSSKRR